MVSRIYIRSNGRFVDLLCNELLYAEGVKSASQKTPSPTQDGLPAPADVIGRLRSRRDRAHVRSRPYFFVGENHPKAASPELISEATT